MNDESDKEAEAIRSEIDTTRQRMDDTMDALGERLKGRHLLDEILGFFRSDTRSEKVAEIREKISHSASNAARSASNAARSVADTVRENPMPALLIGAGVAWWIYSSRKQSSGRRRDDEVYGASGPYDPDAGYDQPLDYPIGEESARGFGETEETGFTVGGSGRESGNGESASNLEPVQVDAPEKGAGLKEQVKQKLGSVADRVRDKTHRAGQQAREMGARVQARTREVYVNTKEKVVVTADQHPLELGLGLIAAGVAVGLVLPTPERVNRLAGPTVDRLRERTRDAGRQFVEKGKRVVNAAGTAMKNEAQQQGLTFDSMRQKVGAVAETTKSVASETALREGVAPAETQSSPLGSANAGSRV